jgi:guanosine-3',5'-bis(diphosphate) 3'-pyrophosphohydrolase
MTEEQKAAEFAIKAHEGQKRKSGEDYITHPIAVVKHLSEEYLSLFPMEAEKGGWFRLDVKECVLAAAWMHDVVEDTSLTVTDLEVAGFKPMTYELVEILTRRKDESYFNYILRIHNGGRPQCDFCGAFRVGAVAIKLADLWHNITDRPAGDPIPDKYLFAEYILKSFNKP